MKEESGSHPNPRLLAGERKFFEWSLNRVQLHDDSRQELVGGGGDLMAKRDVNKRDLQQCSLGGWGGFDKERHLMMSTASAKRLE